MKIPTRADRMAAFKAIFPLLPLSEPMPILFSKSKAKVVPLLFTSVSVVGNIDLSETTAKELGIDDEAFVEDQQGFVDGVPPKDSEVSLADASGAKLPKASLLSPKQYGKRIMEDEDPKTLVWMLGLPILDPTKTVAHLTAQLQSSFGAANWIALAKKTGSTWKLVRWAEEAP
jgi:hypothetical protein